MVVFTVYEPPHSSGDRVDRAERLVFVKDGFHWWAALAPALWLIVKGLWLELLVFLVAASALAGLLEAMGVTPEATGVLFLIAQIVIGFEAASIYAAALRRRGWRQAGIVTGRTLMDCERRFFEEWLPAQPKVLAEPDGMPSPQSKVAIWRQSALEAAREAMQRGRRLVSAKA